MDSGCVSNGIVSIRCIPSFIKNIGYFIYPLAGVAAVIFTLYASWKFIISKGDPIKITEAKRTLTFAIVGMIIVVMSYFIIKIVSLVTGAECISLLGFDKCR